MSQHGAMVCLVRHADAGDKRAWRGADGDRPLSDQGWREAAGLVIRLEDFPINRILSSPALRCTQTVGPLAARNRLPVEESDLLRIDADVAALAAWIQARADGHIVLCTHGELLADLLRLLVANGEVMRDALAWPKGSTWVLQQTDDGPLRGRFLPPLAWPVTQNPVRDGFWRPLADPGGGSTRPQSRRQSWSDRLKERKAPERRGTDG